MLGACSNNKPQVWATVIEMLTLANSTDYGTIHVKPLSNKLWLCLNGSEHNEPQFEVLNVSVVLRVIFTISDDEEDEGFVAEQPENGSCIGVALRRDLPSRGLSVAGRDLRTLLKHWQEHKTQNTNSSNVVDLSPVSLCNWTLQLSSLLFKIVFGDSNKSEIKIEYQMKN